MEYIIAASIVGLGFILKNENKTNKRGVIEKNFKKEIPPSQLPTPVTVYTSKRAYNIFEGEQKKADVLFDKSLYPQDTNIVTPGPPVPIIYNKVDYTDKQLPVEFNSYQSYDNITIDNSTPILEKNPNPANLSKSEPDSGGWTGISLTGNQINPNKFTHNNMIPFFGGGVTQNLDEFSTRGIFENFTGTQDNYQKKQEQGLLFQPQKNMSNVYGTGSLDGFLLDRYYVSNIRSNETPIEKVYVGPGLNQGFTNEPSGGFQQADTLDYVMPKTVDETRVKTDPKISYYGRINPGAKIAKPGKIGTVYKNKPDTFYIQEPDRYFTTTGQVIAAEQRPCIVTKYTNRKTTELKTRTGSAAPTNGTVAQIRSKYKISPKVTYSPGPPRNVDGAGQWSILNLLGLDNTKRPASQPSIPNDYGKQSFRVRNDKRELMNLSGKKVVMNYKSPIEKGSSRNKQSPKQTKKQEQINNPKIYGNLNAHKKGIIYDPNNVPKTTIKETNIYNDYQGGAQNKNRGGVVYDPNDTTRTTIKETNIHNSHSGILNSNTPKGIAYDPNDIMRTTIKETNIHNSHSGIMNSNTPKGIAYDPNDTTRTTIKETNIHNSHSGSMNSNTPKGIAYDPNDIMRTTIKETNIHNKYQANAQNKNRGGVVYDPNDTARTTIKETNIHNSHSGILNSNTPKGIVYDPNNITRPTIKETTINNDRKANINNSSKGNYIKNKDKPKKTMKETTMISNAMGIATRKRNDAHVFKEIQVPETIREHSSVSYYGDADGPDLGAYDVTEVNAPNTLRQETADIEYFGGAGNDGVNMKPMSYEDIYNAEIKALRGTNDDGYTPGAMGPNQGVSGDSINVSTSRIGDIQNKYLNERGVQANKVYNSLPQMSSVNLTQEKEIVPNEPLADRINPVIVNAFKENPYTQSLTSWA